MNDFRLLVILFAAFFGLIIVLGIGLLVYQSNPKLFKSNKVAAEDWKPKDVEDGYLSADIEYGYQLLTESQKYMGPQADDEDMVLTGNNLACTSCHSKGGNHPCAASWAGLLSY